MTFNTYTHDKFFLKKGTFKNDMIAKQEKGHFCCYIMENNMKKILCYSTFIILINDSSSIDCVFYLQNQTNYFPTHGHTHLQNVTSTSRLNFTFGLQLFYEKLVSTKCLKVTCSRQNTFRVKVMFRGSTSKTPN